MMPAECITIEHQIMAGKLNILLIAFKTTDNGYKLTEVGDTPVWKQEL
jgi:hypothetical protein